MIAVIVVAAVDLNVDVICSDVPGSGSRRQRRAVRVGISVDHRSHSGGQSADDRVAFDAVIFQLFDNEHGIGIDLGGIYQYPDVEFDSAADDIVVGLLRVKDDSHQVFSGDPRESCRGEVVSCIRQRGIVFGKHDLPCQPCRYSRHRRSVTRAVVDVYPPVVHIRAVGIFEVDVFRQVNVSGSNRLFEGQRSGIVIIVYRDPDQISADVYGLNGLPGHAAVNGIRDGIPFGQSRRTVFAQEGFGEFDIIVYVQFSVHISVVQKVYRFFAQYRNEFHLVSGKFLRLYYYPQRSRQRFVIDVDIGIFGIVSARPVLIYACGVPQRNYFTRRSFG